MIQSCIVCKYLKEMAELSNLDMHDVKKKDSRCICLVMRCDDYQLMPLMKSQHIKAHVLMKQDGSYLMSSKLKSIARNCTCSISICICSLSDREWLSTVTDLVTLQKCYFENNDESLMAIRIQLLLFNGLHREDLPENLKLLNCLRFDNYMTEDKAAAVACKLLKMHDDRKKPGINCIPSNTEDALGLSTFLVMRNTDCELRPLMKSNRIKTFIIMNTKGQYCIPAILVKAGRNISHSVWICICCLCDIHWLQNVSQLVTLQKHELGNNDELPKAVGIHLLLFNGLRIECLPADLRSLNSWTVENYMTEEKTADVINKLSMVQDDRGNACEHHHTVQHEFVKG